MNKSFIRLTITLVLIIVLLVLLLAADSVGFTAVWLQTYKAFTKERLVAEISVTEQKNENGQETFELNYKAVNEESALLKIFKKESEEKDRFGEDVSYTLKGNQFEIGGEVIKFNNWTTFLGFETIYKVSRLESDYEDAADAQSRERTVIELNGGTDSYWKTLEKNQENLSSLVDTVYGSYAGKFVQDENMTYGLYITEDGFILDDLETIDY